MARYIVPLLLLFLLTISPPSFSGIGDYYQWTDRDDNVHITDDLLNVPQEYKDKVRVIESTHIEEDDIEEDELDVTPTPVQRDEELFGGQSLSWWQWRLDRKRQEVEDAERLVAERKRYIDVFEKARRLAQRFTEEEFEAYKNYKDDLPANDERLTKLREELEELKRRARIAGVPKSVRE
jgi:DNA repair exonuclease SbcCD ATPase subunit